MSFIPAAANPVPVKAVRIQTIIPFSFPFSQKRLRFKIEDTSITVSFKTEKREDIARLLFPAMMPKLRFDTDSIGVAGFGHIHDDWSWMSPDRFGQLNFMKAVFRIDLDEQKTDDFVSEETRGKYLSKCADVINLISAGYRILTNDYFPKTYTQQDFMAYSFSYSIDGLTFQGETTCTGSNVSFRSSYPDDSPHVDINDIISDYVVKMPLHTELIMNGEDFLRDKNYRIAFMPAY